MFLHGFIKGFSVKHGEDFAFISDLHGRRVVVGVASNDLLA